MLYYVERMQRAEVVFRRHHIKRLRSLLMTAGGTMAYRMITETVYPLGVLVVDAAAVQLRRTWIRKVWCFVKVCWE